MDEKHLFDEEEREGDQNMNHNANICLYCLLLKHICKRLLPMMYVHLLLDTNYLPKLNFIILR